MARIILDFFRKMDYYLQSTITTLLCVFSTIRNFIRTIRLVWNTSGPPTVPLFGNVFLINENKKLMDYGKNAHALYGSFFRVWIAILPAIFIYEPRHLKPILSTNKNSKKSIFYRALLTFLGEGLLTNNGYRWKKNRKMIQPYLHINILEKFVDLFAECSNRFVAKLEGEQTVKITSFINECILDILHNGVLGVPLDKDSPYRKGEMHAMERFMRPWLLFEPIFRWTKNATNERQQKNKLCNYTKQILYDRKNDTTKASKHCFLDMFMEIAEKNPEFTENDLINETVTFMLAGQDSVGATLAFALYFIAKHPEVQDKIMQEISRFDVDEKLTMQELNEMKYLEQVLKETLRLTPPVPMITRVLTEDVMLDDQVFPSGTHLFISPFITHRLPHIYPDPEKFDPDRFEESNFKKLHPYAFLPFSLGPRNCIGYKFAYMELKTILFFLLKKYRISLPPGKDTINLAWRATLRATGGVWLTLDSRNI